MAEGGVRIALEWTMFHDIYLVEVTFLFIYSSFRLKCLHLLLGSWFVHIHHLQVDGLL